MGFFIMQKESVLFYRSFYDCLQTLKADDKIILYDAILNYGFEMLEPKLPNHLSAFWILIKPQLDANWKKYKDGQKGGRPRKKETSGYLDENHRLIYLKPNVNDNVNHKDNEKENEKEMDDFLKHKKEMEEYYANVGK